MSKPSKAVTEAPVSLFTGIARTLVCVSNNGFRNFRILTLHLLKGKVVREHLSDCYASFEAMAKMDASNEKSAQKLNNRWVEGLGMRDFDAAMEPELPPDPLGGRLK